MVFLTPKILRHSEDHKKLLNNKMTKRIDWLKRNAAGRDPFGEHLADIAKFADSPDEFRLEDQPVAPTTNEAPVDDVGSEVETLEIEPTDMYNEEEVPPAE